MTLLDELLEMGAVESIVHPLAKLVAKDVLKLTEAAASHQEVLDLCKKELAASRLGLSFNSDELC